MDAARRILIVARSPKLVTALITELGRSARYELVLVTSFACAKRHLKTRPDLVITEVKLGEYNGLHVALRARADGIPSLVLGPTDDDFRLEALRIGADYLTYGESAETRLDTTIARLVEHQPMTDLGFVGSQQTGSYPDASLVVH